MGWFTDLFNKKDINQTEKADSESCSVVPETMSAPPAYYVYKFLLVGNESKERQQTLRELKIKLWVDGIQANLALEIDDIADIGKIKLNEIELGQIGPLDLAWIKDNFESITQLSNVKILGGATDIENNPRPFVAEISAEIFSQKPAPCFSMPTLSEVKTYHRCKGDAVCYVSKSKKVHIGFCSSVNIENCKPMLVEEAFMLGYDFCSKCF